MLLAAARAAYLAGDAQRRVWLAACLASLTTYAVHCLSDSPVTYNHALIPLAAVLAITLRLVAASRPVPATSTPLRLLPRVLVVALLPLLLAGHVLVDRPQASYDESLRSMADGDFVRAAIEAEAAAGRDPQNAAYQFLAGVSNALLYQQAPEAGGEPLHRAAAYIERGLRLHPHSTLGYANLAQVRLLLANPEAAAQAARQALATSRVDVTIAAQAGSVLAATGHADEAAVAYGRAIRLHPGLSQSPFWTTTPERASLRDAAMAASGLSACALGRPAVLYRTYDDDLAALERDCRAVVEAGGGSLARADLALLMYANGRVDEALAEARAASATASSQRAERVAVGAALGLVLSATGDIKAVRRELLTNAYLADPDARVLLALTYGPPDNEMARRLALTADGSGLPRAVRGLAANSLRRAQSTKLADVSQFYRIGVNYYRLEFLRQAPRYLYVPGDWQELTSPRTAALRAIVGEE
jgi:tetratricopeptide (TPR) repeat protein